MTPFKTILLAVAMIPAAASAQCFGLTEKGTTLSYAFELGGKDVGVCMTVTADAVTETPDGVRTVDYLYNMLDSKGNVHKSAKMMGMADGLIIPVRYAGCDYYLTEDFIFCQTDNRMGYLMKVPEEMTVGQTIEGGTFKSSAKLPVGGTVKNEVTFSGLSVTAEEDVALADGSTVHCYVISGRATGKCYRANLDSEVKLYFAKGIGIVREEVARYIDTKKTYTASLTSIQK